MTNVSKEVCAVLLVTAVAIWPSHLMAGGLSSAVADTRVENVAAREGSVWCQRLGTDVPARLSSQMDCGVASERVASGRKSGGLLQLFERFPHKRIGNTPSEDGPTTSDVPSSKPNPPEKPKPPVIPTEKPTPTDKPNPLVKPTEIPTPIDKPTDRPNPTDEPQKI